jgi:hypothetical protein
MQFNIGMARFQLGPFGLRFLHPVFTKDPLALRDQRFDLLDRLGLGNGDQRDVAVLAAGDAGGGVVLFANLSELSIWFHHGAVL